MSFTEAVRTCFRKYFVFSGRASRPEYWWFMLFLLIGNVLASALDGALFGWDVPVEDIAGDELEFNTPEASGPIAILFSLATFIPSISAGWRRMHDTGRSGLYLFYPLIVMIGIGLFMGVMGSFGDTFGSIVLVAAILVLLISPLLVLWWLTRPSEPGANQYGPHPREPQAKAYV
jgi:uncharacterized membrane protein YhaH (DUF805 family)